MLRIILELSACLCDFCFFFYKKNRALNSVQHRTVLKVIFTVELTQKKGQKSSELDFQLVAYQIFSSIGRKGEREGKEGCGKVGGWENEQLQHQFIPVI